MIEVFRRDHFATVRPAQLVAVNGRSFEWLDIRTDTAAQLRDPVTLERAWVPLVAITVPAQPQWAPTHPATSEAGRPFCKCSYRGVRRKTVSSSRRS